VRIFWTLAFVGFVACAGSSGQEVRSGGATPEALEEFRLACPDYYDKTTEKQRANLLDRVIVAGYPECAVVFMLGEPRARRPVMDLPGAEQWYYDRDPGYLEVTMKDGTIASWSRCSSCRRWYTQ
jgi:hypothetical protein